MPTYQVEWTREVWYRSQVEAETLEEARERFWAGDYDDDSDTIFGSEIQDSLEFREVEDLDKFDVLITGRGMAEETEVENV